MVRPCQRSQRSGGVGSLVHPSNTPAAMLRRIRVVQASESMADPAMTVRECCSSLPMRRSEMPASVAVKPSHGLRFAPATFQGTARARNASKSTAPQAIVIPFSPRLCSSCQRPEHGRSGKLNARGCQGSKWASGGSRKITSTSDSGVMHEKRQSQMRALPVTEVVQLRSPAWCIGHHLH